MQRIEIKGTSMFMHRHEFEPVSPKLVEVVVVHVIGLGVTTIHPSIHPLTKRTIYFKYIRHERKRNISAHQSNFQSVYKEGSH